MMIIEKNVESGIASRYYNCASHEMAVKGMDSGLVIDHMVFFI